MSTCKHINRRKIEENYDVYYHCPDCNRNFRSFKRNTARILARYMTLSGQGNSLQNFVLGKVEAFLQWSVYFMGAKVATEFAVNRFAGINFVLPSWVFGIFMLAPVVNIFSDPLLGWLAKKSGYLAELSRYTSADAELNPVLKEILENTRKTSYTSIYASITTEMYEMMRETYQKMFPEKQQRPNILDNQLK